MVLILSPQLEKSLFNIANRSSLLLSALEPALPKALKEASKESKMIAYKKMIEAEMGFTLPRSVLQIRTRKIDCYGNKLEPEK